jgi:hypothetical protein
MDLLNRPDLIHAVELFAAACHQSRAWDSEYSIARMKYGAHGPAVSGIGRDHFPDPVKARLRDLARQVSAFSEAGHGARPKGVRRATMIKLGRAVAARDGAGFYGPQP